MDKYSERLNAIYNATPDTIMLFGENGFIDCNPATLQMFGCATKAEFLGRHPGEYSPPTQPDGSDSRVAANEKLRVAFEEGANLFEWAHRRANGEVFPAEVQLLRLDLAEGSIIQATVRDITEHKALREQLVQSQKMEAVGQLVGGVAHEFNNLVGSITGRLHLAKLASLPQGQTFNHIQLAEQQCQRLADMVEQLLAFARKSPVQMKICDLAQVIEEAFKLHRVGITANIAVSYRTSQVPLPVVCANSQIQQILVNLLNNARDAVATVPDPKITISVDAANSDDRSIPEGADRRREGYALLSVTDNGVGIDDADIHRVCQPFFTTKSTGQGTGLGLAMVFGAVQSHGGFLQIESKKSAGTSVNVYLPISPSTAADSITQDADPPRASGETLLLVDDDDELRTTMREVLETFGYSVIEAANGQHAVDIFLARHHEIAVVIMDIVMPIMGGIEAAVEMRKQHSDVKVLFCTGYDPASVSDDNAMAASPTISKPIDIAEMQRLIRQLIGQRG